MHPDNCHGAAPVKRYTKEELKRIRLKNLRQRMYAVQGDCERIAIELEREDFKDNSASLSCAIANLKMASKKLETQMRRI